MLYQPFFDYESSTIWTKLQAGCEVWEFNLETKHVRAGRTLRNPLDQGFPDLKHWRTILGTWWQRGLPGPAPETPILGMCFGYGAAVTQNTRGGTLLSPTPVAYSRGSGEAARVAMAKDTQGTLPSSGAEHLEATRFSRMVRNQPLPTASNWTPCLWPTWLLLLLEAKWISFCL